jgi:hypothetical protein
MSRNNFFVDLPVRVLDGIMAACAVHILYLALESQTAFRVCFDGIRTIVNSLPSIVAMRCRNAGFTPLI